MKPPDIRINRPRLRVHKNQISPSFRNNPAYPAPRPVHIAGVPRDDVAVTVHDGLAGSCTDVHADIVPVRVEIPDALDVAALFVKSRFQRIPVVKDKKVLGIIYRSRLLFAMSTCMLA